MLIGPCGVVDVGQNNLPMMDVSGQSVCACMCVHACVFLHVCSWFINVRNIHWSACFHQGLMLTGARSIYIYIMCV